MNQSLMLQEKEKNNKFIINRNPHPKLSQPNEGTTLLLDPENGNIHSAPPARSVTHRAQSCPQISGFELFPQKGTGTQGIPVICSAKALQKESAKH